MNTDYLAKIRGSVNLYTKRKTSNVLEGGFRSVFRGRSLEFDDLKEYDFGDDVHDIDWKSSSRTGKILVRRYVAEKKHNVLFVGDTGVKMSGHTSALQVKQEVALMIFGTIAYLSDRQGADFSLIYGTEKGMRMNPFRSGTGHMETMLYEYRRDMIKNGTTEAAKVLEKCAEQIRKKMVIFLITDLPGAAAVTEKLARKVTVNNDLLIFCIDDAWYFGREVYDLSRGRYENPFFLGSRRLRAQEEALREGMKKQIRHICSRNKINLAVVSREEDILDETMKLFERYRNGIYG